MFCFLFSHLLYVEYFCEVPQCQAVYVENLAFVSCKIFLSCLSHAVLLLVVSPVPWLP